MKKMLMCGVLVALYCGDAVAQKQQQKVGASKSAASATKKAPTQKSTRKSESSPVTSKTYNLMHTNNSAALNGNTINSRYFIADTTVRVLNYRAATGGTNPNVTLRQVTGVGKGAYGIFKGRLTLMPLGARSSGATTGSGSVGTGTSLGVMGSSGPAIGLNGKNPYAGSSIYGTPRPGSNLNDSTKNRWLRN